MGDVTHHGVGVILVHPDIETIAANVQTVNIKMMTVRGLRLAPLDSLRETSALIRHNIRTHWATVHLSSNTFWHRVHETS